MEKHPESARATVLFNATSLRHASFMRWEANLAAPPNQTTTCFPKTPLVLYLSAVNIHRKQQGCFIQRTLIPNMKAFYFQPRTTWAENPSITGVESEENQIKRKWDSCRTAIRRQLFWIFFTHDLENPINSSCLPSDMLRFMPWTDNLRTKPDSRCRVSEWAMKKGLLTQYPTEYGLRTKQKAKQRSKLYHTIQINRDKSYKF